MNFNLRSKWLWAAVAAYVLFLLITLPANLLGKTLARHDIHTSSLQGTLWNGHANGVQAGVLNLGNIDWRLRFLPLLTGKLAADVKLKQNDGYAETRASIGITGKLILSDLSASLPLQSLVGSGGLPGGWLGTAQLKFSELIFRNGWPVDAHGSLDVIDLTGPAQQPSNIGAYRLVFPTANATAGALTGSLEALRDAAIEVTGSLKLASDRSYQLDTLVATRGNTPKNIADGMQILGTPDAQGRRPFSVSGTM